MSQETIEWLNQNILVGYTDKRGNAWHYKESAQGAEPNHYPGAIPLEDVERRLFNFTVEPQPVYVCVGEDNFIRVPNKQAQVTSDDGTVLGIFSAGYKGHQYQPWLVENVATILDDDLQIGSAGLLRNRGVAYVSVEVPENLKTPEGVEFRPNLLAATSFDGTVATTYKRCITNVVCDNTMDAGLREDGQVYKLRHSAHSLGRIADARDALAIIYDAADAFMAEVAQLTNTSVSDNQWISLLDKLVPVVDPQGQALEGRGLTVAQNKRGTLQTLWNEDDRVTPWKNTAFGALQAFNTYGAHLSTVRGRNGKEANRVERNLLDDISGRRSAADSEVIAALELALV